MRFESRKRCCDQRYLTTRLCGTAGAGGVKKQLEFKGKCP